MSQEPRAPSPPCQGDPPHHQQTPSPSSNVPNPPVEQPCYPKHHLEDVNVKRKAVQLLVSTDVQTLYLKGVEVNEEGWQCLGRMSDASIQELFSTIRHRDAINHQDGSKQGDGGKNSEGKRSPTSSFLGPGQTVGSGWPLLRMGSNQDGSDISTSKFIKAPLT